MDICLIIPPSAFLLDERVFPSLGLLKIASSLESQNHNVKVLDLSGVSNYLESLEYFLRTETVKVFGITTTTPQMPSVEKIRAHIRTHNKESKIILGGPHVTLLYASAKLEKKKGLVGGRGSRAVDKLEELYDVLVAGDGEIAILLAINPNAPKYIDADDRKKQFFMNDEAYERTPLAARHLIDMSSYHYSIEGHSSTSLIAQLGCPFYCGFCGGRNSQSLRIPRNRGVDSIISEIKDLHCTYGYTGFMFYDDELNVNRQRFLELLNRITQLQTDLGVDFRLRGFVKAELFDQEQAIAMYKAGFRWLLCGFEAASERILSNIKKRATLDDNTRAVEFAKYAGLKVKALMSCGHPGESEKSILSIRDWLTSVDIDDFDCTVITAYPGTPYHDEALPHLTLGGVWTYTVPDTGDRLHSIECDYMDEPQYYKGDPNGGYQSYVFTDHLKPEEIVKLRDKVERDVRDKLNIPFNVSRAAQRYEHSMGQGLPDFIFRSSGILNSDVA